MRIIAGRFRSRTLLPPESDETTRPITDRVKQSLFDILTPLLPDAVVYDVFAGTGSMGLESLSRGARHATFYEADRSALTRLKRNIATLGVQAQSTIIPSDLFKHFQSSPPPTAPADLASLIFLDPPYRFLAERPDHLRSLAERFASHLAPGGYVLFRHDAKDRLDLPALHLAECRTYGGMTIDFLCRGSTAMSPQSAKRT